MYGLLPPVVGLPQSLSHTAGGACAVGHAVVGYELEALEVGDECRAPAVPVLILTLKFIIKEDLVLNPRMCQCQINKI